jgi:hypothetical protein
MAEQEQEQVNEVYMAIDGLKLLFDCIHERRDQSFLYFENAILEYLIGVSGRYSKDQIKKINSSLVCNGQIFIKFDEYSIVFDADKLLLDNKTLDYFIKRNAARSSGE